jgi:hypothetical protein
MKQRWLLPALFLLECLAAPLTFTQNLPADRRVDWSRAGIHHPVPQYPNVIDFTLHGGKGDGVTDEYPALKALLDALPGKGNVIYFPHGVYVFKSTITLPDSVVLRGAGSDSTTIQFSLGGNAANGINIYGRGAGDAVRLTADAAQGDSILVLGNTSLFHTGDYVRLFQDDSLLVTSDWARYSVGQIARISSIPSTDKVVLSSPLRRAYAFADHPILAWIFPVVGAGIECLSIERMDQTTGQSSNISCNYAAECWVIGVKSFKTNYAHIELSASTNISIQGSNFHHAFQYGDGGQGYGIALQSTSGECLVENNSFNNLRHAILFQSGANGNVIGYNYSVDPYGSEMLPPSSAGDMVLHGNYPYANLFEGNVCQNIVIDASHGVNGPHNTFFRNRVELYGIRMNVLDASDRQNFIANDITNTGLLLGYYLLFGSDQFEYGNRVQGSVVPTGTTSVTQQSFYLNGKPNFWKPGSSTWPVIGIPMPYDVGNIPAYDRYAASTPTDCEHYDVFTGIRATGPPAATDLLVFPNPVSDALHLCTKKMGLKYAIHNRLGQLLLSGTVNAETVIPFGGFASGLYFVRVFTNAGSLSTVPVINIK